MKPISVASAVCALLAIALAGAWWTTAGDWDLWAPISFGDVFDAQAQSYLQGRTDIDCTVASGEAFRRNGKCYVYFGPVPALLRIPPMLIAPRTAGHWSRMMLIDSSWLLVALICLLLVFAGYKITDPLAVGYLLVAVLGSSVVYLWSWPTAYVEAIALAVVFAIASIYCLLRSVSAARDGAAAAGGGWLVAATVAGLFCYFTRANTGAGPLFAASMLALSGFRRGGRWTRPTRAQIATLALVASGAVAFVIYNYLRFGAYFNAVPIQLHVQYDELRIRHVGGTLFHPEQSLTLFLNYLFNIPVPRASYPWLEFRPIPSYFGNLDIVEVHAGVLATMPALVWLAWAGLTHGAGLRNRAARWILLSPLISLLLLSSIAAVNHRYVHEFTALLIPAGVFGLSWAWQTPRRRWITIALSIWSIYANWALALVAQRESQFYVSEEAKDRHRATRYAVDRWLGVEPPGEYAFDYERAEAPPPVEGLVVHLTNHGGRYRYTGSRWQHLSGPVAHRFRFTMQWNELPQDANLELLAIGRLERPDRVVLQKGTGPSQYRLCIDHWTTAIECGRDFALTTAREYRVDCSFDRLNREVRLLLDGEEVAVRRRTPLFPWRESSAEVNRPKAALPGTFRLIQD